jgi:hypothetical protein
MVFNATFNNIQLYRGGQFYYRRKPEDLEKTTDKLLWSLSLKLNQISVFDIGRDRMVVGFTTTYAISAYHH